MRNIIFSLAYSSEIDHKVEMDTNNQSNKINKLKLWTWITADFKRDDNSYKKEFKKYTENGIDAVLINTHTSSELLKRLTPIAIDFGLEVHAWIWTMNRANDTIALKNPSWYAVNRAGESCFDNRPYVNHYQWLCPSQVESRNHILKLIESLALVNGISSVHLDYIRYSDIYLPIGLQPKYNLVQYKEMPEFDYCYCETCINEFELIHNRNPKPMEFPELDIEWKNFRFNKIKAVVDDAYDLVHKNNKQLSAAVFPYPEMAGQMVRQRWDKWKIDFILPMLYHHFYNENIDWITFCTKQCLSDVKYKNQEIHPGIYIANISPNELSQILDNISKTGAKGVSIFSGNGISDEQFSILGSYKDLK